MADGAKQLINLPGLASPLASNYTYTLLDRTRFRARVDVVTSDHNNRVIPIVFSRLVLTKS